MIKETRLAIDSCSSLSIDAMRVFISNSNISDRVARPILFDRSGKLREFFYYSTERDDDGELSMIREEDLFLG